MCFFHFISRIFLHVWQFILTKIPAAETFETKKSGPSKEPQRYSSLKKTTPVNVRFIKIVLGNWTPYRITGHKILKDDIFGFYDKTAGKNIVWCKVIWALPKLPASITILLFFFFLVRKIYFFPSRHCSAEPRKLIFPKRNTVRHRSRSALYSVVALDRDKLSETSQRRLRPSIYLPRFSDMSRNLTSAAWRRRKCCQLDLWNINHTLLLCHIKWPIFCFQSPRRRISVINRRQKRKKEEVGWINAQHMQLLMSGRMISPLTTWEGKRDAWTWYYLVEGPQYTTCLPVINIFLGKRADSTV